MGPPATCEDTCDGVCLDAAYGGGCGQRCSDSSECPSGTGCSPIPADTDGDGSIDRVDSACVPFTDSGRFVGGACSGSTGGSPLCDSRTCYRGQCVISCDDDGDCLPGQTCQDGVPWDEATFRTCFDAPGLASGELELARTTLRSGGLGNATFAVPRTATSVAFVLRQMDGTELPLTFVELIDPADQVIFDIEGIAGGTDQPIRWLPLGTNQVAAMLVPNSTPDRVRFRHGRHRLTWSAFQTASGEVAEGDTRLIARFAKGSGARLRLHLHFAPGIGVDAASAPTTARLQNALAAMAATYASAGITVEVAGYANVSGNQFTIIDSTDGPDSEMAQLFARGIGTDDVLDVFFVREIDTPDSIVLGIAGGIPGPPGEHAALSSGVVVTYDSGIVGGSANLGQVIAHEAGHYLGLFHSTENGTPCAPGEFEGCAPFGGGDVLTDTSRGDNRNMMYFALQTFGGGTTNNRISDGQQFVLQRNPLVLR